MKELEECHEFVFNEIKSRQIKENLDKIEIIFESLYNLKVKASYLNNYTVNLKNIKNIEVYIDNSFYINGAKVNILIDKHRTYCYTVISLNGNIEKITISTNDMIDIISYNIDTKPAYWVKKNYEYLIWIVNSIDRNSLALIFNKVMKRVGKWQFEQ